MLREDQLAFLDPPIHVAATGGPGHAAQAPSHTTRPGRRLLAGDDESSGSGSGGSGGGGGSGGSGGSSHPARQLRDASTAAAKAREVLVRVLRHLDLPKQHLPLLLTAAGLGSDAAGAASASAGGDRDDNERPSGSPAGAGSGSGAGAGNGGSGGGNGGEQPSASPHASQLAASLSALPAEYSSGALRRKRRGAILREHGAGCLALLRAFYAPHNLELAALTDDPAFAAWNR